MARSRSIPVPAVLTALAILLMGCATLAQPRDEGVSLDQIPVVTNIDVIVERCEPGADRIAIDPWTAYVHRDSTVTWTIHGPATQIVVRSKARGLGKWPFDWGGRWPAHNVRASTPGSDTLHAGAANRGRVNRVHGYYVFVHCNGRVVPIDPEVVLLPPPD